MMTSTESNNLINDQPTPLLSSNRRQRKVVQSSLKSAVKKLCRVCGQRAYRPHFGVLSCERCRSFYLRSVTKSLTYKCLKQEDKCHISSQTKDSYCKRCLFHKCEASGMTRLAVKLSRKGSGKHLSISTPSHIVALHKAYTQLLQDYDKKVAEQKIRPLLLTDEPLEKSVISYKAAMFSQLCSHYEKIVKDIVEFSRLVPGFTGLHPDDQLILLKTGFIDIWCILNATRLSLVQDSVTLSDGTQIPICEVTTIYTKDYVTSLMDLSDECKSLRLLPSDKAILIALALIKPDRPNVIDKDKISELNASYMSLMRKYAAATRPNSPRFGAGMQGVLSSVADIGKQHSLLLNMYRADVRKLSISPVITELFDLHPLSAYKEN